MRRELYLFTSIFVVERGDIQNYIQIFGNETQTFQTKCVYDRLREEVYFA